MPNERWPHKIFGWKPPAFRGADSLQAGDWRESGDDRHRSTVGRLGRQKGMELSWEEALHGTPVKLKVSYESKRYTLHFLNFSVGVCGLETVVFHCQKLNKNILNCRHKIGRCSVIINIIDIHWNEIRRNSHPLSAIVNICKLRNLISFMNYHCSFTHLLRRRDENMNFYFRRKSESNSRVPYSNFDNTTKLCLPWGSGVRFRR